MQVGHTLRGAMLGIGAASIWGAMFVVSDQLLEYIPPITLVAVRLLLSASLFVLILAAQRKLIIPRRDALRLLGVGMVGFGISIGAQFAGTAFSTAINGSVITSSVPAFVLIFAWLILREPLTPIKVLAGTVAAVGVLVVLDLSQFSLSSERFIGDVFLVLAAITWAIYSVLVRRDSARWSTLTITTYALLGGLIICLPLGLFELRGYTLPPITLEMVLGVLFLAYIAMALANWMWNRAFALVPAGTAALFLFAQPLVGALLGNWVLGQAITPQIVLGGALIALGVLIALRASP